MSLASLKEKLKKAGMVQSGDKGMLEFRKLLNFLFTYLLLFFKVFYLILYFVFNLLLK